MGILEEVRKFLKNILDWVYLLLGFAALFFFFGLKEVSVFGRNYLAPTLGGDSFVVQVFKKIQYDFLPPGVHLAVTNPTSAFVSQILISLLVAFIVTFPFFLYKIIQYLKPAMFPRERKLIFQALIPSVLLFFTGCVFGYYFLIPTTFEVLYPYALDINATTFFLLDEFITSVLSLMIITGIMFLLPVSMVILSFLGVIEHKFWTSHLRHVSLFFMIFTAIITPDGTGITMLILLFPLLSLYYAGCLLTGAFEDSNI